MKVSNVVAMKAMQAVQQIHTEYPVEPVGTVPGTAERQVLDDLSALRLLVGAWASRNDLEVLVFEKAQQAIRRWEARADQVT
jgi:hypothetical protein